MHILTKEQILKARGRRFEVVEVPAFGGAVKLGSLSAGDALKVQSLQRRKEAGEDVDGEMFLFLITTVCVEPAFTRQDVEAMSIEAASALVAEITKFIAPTEEKPEGNSAASQSAS